MKINNNFESSTFKAKFIKNKAFQDVVNYAEKTNMLRDLDTALNSIKTSNEGEILIIHGQSGNKIFSNFTYFKDKNHYVKNSVQNLSLEAHTPEESSFNAIIELGTLGKKFKKLVGEKIQNNVTARSILEKYTIN